MLIDPQGWSHQRCLVLGPWIDLLLEDVEGGGEPHSGQLSTALVPIVVLGRQCLPPIALRPVVNVAGWGECASCTMGAGAWVEALPALPGLALLVRPPPRG